jgi:FKBP-type peptidyl-prolyl cis-trans isomerase FkpA
MAMRLLIPLLVTASLALPAAAQPSVELDSEDEKIVYTMGVMVGRTFGSANFTESEIEILKRGIADQVFERPLAVNFEEYGPKIDELFSRRRAIVAKEEREASKPFLAEAAAAPGATKTESGLIYIETKAGTGASPGPEDRVKVHYDGTLRDGTVFDSTRSRGAPASFSLNRVIPCWSEAIQMMKVGGQATIVCPPEIAYGDRGVGQIKPGAALRFEVELISVE